MMSADAAVVCPLPLYIGLYTF